MITFSFNLQKLMISTALPSASFLYANIPLYSSSEVVFDHTHKLILILDYSTVLCNYALHIVYIYMYTRIQM